MQAVPFLAFVILVIVIGFYSWYNSEDRKIRRALEQAPIVPIQDAKSGDIVKFVGRVRSNGQMLKGPFSHRDCTYYHATVEEYRSSGKSGRWVQVIREFNAVDFLLEDQTGRAFIRGSWLKVSLVKDTQLASGTFNDATPDLEEFLMRHGQRSEGWLFNRRLRYREGMFEPNEKIAVLGVVRWEHDPDPNKAGLGYRDAPKRVVLEPLEGGFIMASDVPTTTG